MATYTVNSACVQHVTELIDAHQWVLDSDWSEAQPTTDQENAFIAEHGWTAYSQWHLGLHDQQDNDHTKDRYGFCVGDFHKVHRRGLIGAIDRAAEWHHDEIEDAARSLLDHLDVVAAADER